MAINITTTTLPNAIQGVAYSQTVDTVGGQSPLVFSKPTGSFPAGSPAFAIGSSTGIITGTPTTPGTYTFSIKVVDDNALEDTQSYTIRTFAPLNISPDPVSPATTIIVEAGSQVDFSATGGSGNFLWSVDGGNLINPTTGLLTALNGGNYTVTLTDLTSGQTATALITITSQSQFCVTGTSAEAELEIAGNACCEFNVECGDKLQLRIPSFHVMENGVKQNVVYGDLVQATIGEAGRLRSTGDGAGATGNLVSFNRDSYFEIITTADMADTAAGEFAIGFSSVNQDATVGTIAHSVTWFTDSSARYVELRHAGTAEASSKFAIAEGDAVTFGVIGGAMQLWINSVLMFTSAVDFSACGDVMLDVGIELAGKTIGGYVDGLSWSILTSGTNVGAIDADGIYTAPVDPLVGIIQIVGTVGTANFYVNVRNIQPTPRYTNPNSFIAGRRADVWVTNRKPTDNDVIRIASDGSPDAIQNPGMINLGVLEGSAKFAEEITYQDFDNDEGTYQTSISAEKGTFTGTFLEVRDFDKMAMLMQHATLYPKVKGVRELSVGGKSRTGCDLRMVLIVQGNGGGWDVIYLPRVQNNSNLNLEFGKKTNAKAELSMKVLPDVSRTPGRQLYSMYQIDNCSDVDSGATCE